MSIRTILMAAAILTVMGTSGSSASSKCSVHLKFGIGLFAYDGQEILNTFRDKTSVSCYGTKRSFSLINWGNMDPGSGRAWVLTEYLDCPYQCPNAAGFGETDVPPLPDIPKPGP